MKEHPGPDRKITCRVSILTGPEGPVHGRGSVLSGLLPAAPLPIAATRLARVGISCQVSSGTNAPTMRVFHHSDSR